MALLWLTCECGQRMKVLDAVVGLQRPCVRCGKEIAVTDENTVQVDTHGRIQAVKRRIGEMLVQEGLISETQLAEALQHQKKRGGRIVENLISMEFIDPDIFLDFLARQPGIEIVELLNYVIPNEVVRIVPKDFALQYEVLPLDKVDNTLTVGMACPLDSTALKKLEEITSLKVKPLLVSIQELRQALRHYYMPSKIGASTRPTPPVVAEELHPEDAQLILPQVASALTFEGVIRLVREIRMLPALPETVERVRALMQDPDTTTKDVAQIISLDPAITTKVLSLANSASYGFLHRVDNIELATTLLGLREVYSLVLSAAVVDYTSRAKGIDYRAFWRRSMICAIAAKRIANIVHLKEAAGIFAAGLVHDIGRAALAEVAPERYAALDHNSGDEVLIAQENKVFGLAHPEVGYILAQEWRLPLEFAEPMRYHGRVEEALAMREWVAVIDIAQRISEFGGTVPEEALSGLAEACAPAAGMLSLDETALKACLEELRTISV